MLKYNTFSLLLNKIQASFTKKQSGLTYAGNLTIKDLVNKDTDGDGIPDWEERLWGTDPTKPDTVSGIPDSVTIAKLKAEQEATNGQTNTDNQNSGAQTQTDQFSKDFLATVSALSQNGTMDQAMIDKLSSSLADNIKNTPQRKIYTLADVKITNEKTKVTLKKYADSLYAIRPKNSSQNNVASILQKFAPDNSGNNTNPAVLSELDPIIKQTNDFLAGMLKITVPQPLVSAHLDILNALEGISENLTDVKLYDTDPIVSLGGISKYEANATTLNSDFQKIITTIKTTSWKN